MTREEGNLVGEEVHVGDIVQLTQEMRRQYRLNTNDTFDMAQGERFTVTRTENESLVVRTVERKSVRNRRTYNASGFTTQEISFRISRLFLMFDDPNYVPPPPPRRLGKVPTHEEAGLDESVEIIGYDHPGIQWLFNDMGQYATEQSWCSQYDALVAKLGIPGRPRDFTVRSSVKGIALTTTVKARSQREANEIVRAALAAPESITVDTADAE